MSTHLCTCLGAVTNCAKRTSTPVEVQFYLTADGPCHLPYYARKIAYDLLAASWHTAHCQPVDDAGEPLPEPEPQPPTAHQPSRRKATRKAARQLSLSFHP